MRSISLESSVPHSGRWEWPTQLLRNLSRRFYGSMALERKDGAVTESIYQGVTVRIRKPLLQVQGHSNCDNHNLHLFYQITEWRWSQGPDRHRSLERERNDLLASMANVQRADASSARLRGGGARKNWWAAGCMPIDLLGQIFGSRTAGGAFEKLI